MPLLGTYKVSLVQDHPLTLEALHVQGVAAFLWVNIITWYPKSQKAMSSFLGLVLIFWASIYTGLDTEL